MNFVADESCAMPVIRALREAGHDVVAIAEVARGASDDQVLEYATEGKRVLITGAMSADILHFPARVLVRQAAMS